MPCFIQANQTTVRGGSIVMWSRLSVRSGIRDRILGWAILALLVSPATVFGGAAEDWQTAYDAEQAGGVGPRNSQLYKGDPIWGADPNRPGACLPKSR